MFKKLSLKAKKFLCLLLAAAMCLSCSSAAFADTADEGAAQAEGLIHIFLSP